MNKIDLLNLTLAENFQKNDRAYVRRHARFDLGYYDTDTQPVVILEDTYRRNKTIKVMGHSGVRVVSKHDLIKMLPGETAHSPRIKLLVECWEKLDEQLSVFIDRRNTLSHDSWND